jgi:maltose alpha-D-glucosyltransferase/alpha-amylase
VAGLLRSFDYAAALAEHLELGSERLGESAHKRRLIAEFREEAAATFLMAYRAALPAENWTGPSGDEALITLFSLEKAAYELCYEAASRPNWIGVPLRGLSAITTALVGRSLGETA